ncbi:Acetylcholinesterase [Cytospora mali]|uniref:Acetylcholinesterase n=1 Tax=Cytospora mali TaxID=578113 RepID=A0A194VV95_CYTMA|nr:Acetylcholinesterase [Valsa mali]
MIPKLLRKAAFGLIVISTAVATDPIVELETGHVAYNKGVSSGSVEHFHNIKYAHDTSGNRGFAPPEPYHPPEGSVLDATTPGPACPQSKAVTPPVFAETPDISGLVRGSAEDPHWDPDNLITLSTSIGKPVIYVALNFRLTIFGYARLPILGDQNLLNVGMRDQRAGLQWVKDNIAAFGGDPDKITPPSSSAPEAWSMSGPPGTALNITSDASEIHTRAVAEKLECAHESDEDTLSCLREIPMDKLLEVAIEYSVNHHPPMGLFTFIPSVDGDILPDHPSVLYKSGRFSKGTPVVFGWTEDDGAMNAGPALMF